MMSTQNFLQSARKIIIFTCQLLILILCVSYIAFIYYSNISPDKFVKTKYEKTSCDILEKKLATKGELLKRYRADFLVAYTAAGMSYKALISANGLDRSYTTDQASQESLLQQFAINQKYLCWYNPDIPTMVVLVSRHNWSSTFPLFIPSVIGLMMVYYLMQTFFGFLGIANIKTRINNKKKQ